MTLRSAFIDTDTLQTSCGPAALPIAAPVTSPALSGTPTAPTQSLADNSTAIATTAWVKGQGYGTGGSGAVSSVFTRTGAVVATSGDYAVAQVTGAAPLASPALTGTPTAPTAAAATNTTQIATTAFVESEIPLRAPVTSVAGRTGAIVIAEADVTNLTTDLAAKAPLASPTFTGTPAAPTASAGTNTTQLATTAFVATSFSPLASPALTGTATAVNLTVSGVTQAKRINAHGGTALATGDIAVSAGWGTSPTITVVRGTDQAAFIQITAKATVGAAPTVTVTFHDGTWGTVPIVVACRTDTVAANAVPSAAITNQWAVTSVSATAVTFTFNGTPVANSVYGLSYIAMGS